MTLARQIQALRKEKGLSQEELGEKLGVARQSVSKWESGATIPELDKLIAMSRLFGVSVGSILGLEETGEPERELTERELEALEAIAGRLTPPAAEPKKRKRWPYALAALVVAAALGALLGRINGLENQIHGLRSNLSDVQNTVSREVGSIGSQVRRILEEQNRVTAGESYEVTGMDLLNNKVTFALTATPREYREGMRAVFSAVGDFEAVEVPGVLGAGQTFTGSLTCPLTDDITLSVGFVTEESTVTQQLGQEGYLLSGAQLDMRGDLSWTVSYRDGVGSLTRLQAGVWEAGSGWYHDGSAWRELTPEKAELRLWKNRAVVWSEAREELERGLAVEELSIPTEGLEPAPGDRLILSVRYTDTAGREVETFLDGFWITQEKELERIDPREETGSAYPWE